MSWKGLSEDLRSRSPESLLDIMRRITLKSHAEEQVQQGHGSGQLWIDLLDRIVTSGSPSVSIRAEDGEDSHVSASTVDLIRGRWLWTHVRRKQELHCTSHSSIPQPPLSFAFHSRNLSRD